MLRLYLTHPESDTTYECPMSENHKGESPIVSVDWEMEPAVKEMADKVARKMDKPVMEILLNRPKFHIVAKWHPET